MSVLFYTHIRKTAGTSVRRSVFDPHITESKRHRPNGYRAAIAAQGPFDLVQGHFPYGLHHFYGTSNPRYFVMLRRPVDRAVSFYYFVEACSGPSYTHPRLEEVRKNSLTEFYENPIHQNVQTRFVAGLLSDYAGRYLSLNGSLGRAVLRRAKQNLIEQYEAFGLKERFKDSVWLFANRLDVTPEWPEKRHKKTGERPAVSDLDEHVRRTVRQYNSLDVELYRFARKQFGQQAAHLNPETGVMS
ncbi:sulfotransferase family protein [Salinibacter ruber]|uniref:sulfotransferase family protein n=1 Tax=Salinibacter ruber TaxID=146919 RepID=UPI00216A1DB3